MRHLIKPLTHLFLHTHRKALQEGWAFNISLALDRKALRLYDQTLARTMSRLKSKHKGQTPDTQAVQRRVREELAVSLTQLLSRTPLRNPAAYSALKQAVHQWHPWQIDVQQPGNLIREILLSLLPLALKKQQLEGLCNEYRNHLATDIKDQLKSDYPDIHAQIIAEQSRVFGAPPFENGEPRALSIDSCCQTLDRFVAEQAKHLSKPSVSLARAIRKYQAVTTLGNSLKTPIKSVSAQLQDFNRQFSAAKPVIEEDRDSVAMKFLKGVATALSLGAAHLFGIWQVKGQGVAKKIEAALIAPVSDSLFP